MARAFFPTESTLPGYWGSDVSQYLNFIAAAAAIGDSIATDMPHAPKVKPET